MPCNTAAVQRTTARACDGRTGGALAAPSRGARATCRSPRLASSQLVCRSPRAAPGPSPPGGWRLASLLTPSRPRRLAAPVRACQRRRATPPAPGRARAKCAAAPPRSPRCTMDGIGIGLGLTGLLFVRLGLGLQIFMGRHVTFRPNS